MTSPRFARLAARVLTNEPEPLSAPSLEARAAAIEAIARALDAKRSRRRRRAAVLAGVAASVSVAAGVAALWVKRPEPPVAVAPLAPPASPPAVVAHPSGDGATVVGARTTPLVEGEALAPGSRIVARAGGHAILAFATGTRLTVEDEGDVTLVDGGPTSVIAVTRGSLRADVAKLHEHERFLVRTEDAEVEVRGTSFRVSAGGACEGASTRVEVYEGVVVVRHAADEVRVARGESWPNECPSSAPVAPPAPARSVASQARPKDARARAPSALSAQNDLFASAVAAKQNGDTSGAIERFDEFVARWPASALAESAAAQRMKLLHASGSRRAADAARSYLARWPEGFAKAEAEGIVAGAQ